MSPRMQTASNQPQQLFAEQILKQISEMYLAADLPHRFLKVILTQGSEGLIRAEMI